MRFMGFGEEAETLPLPRLRREPAFKPEEVRAEELKYIGHHRHPDKPLEQVEASLIGLALSGGGIRSATTCLGVLQALSRMGILPLVDYLSTVSGGGYIGTGLSSLLSWNGKPDLPSRPRECEAFTFQPGQTPRFGTNWQEFPFRAEHLPPHDDVGQALVAHLRTHGNFLVARLGLWTRETMRGFGSIVPAVALHVAVFVLVLFATAATYMAAVTGLADDAPALLGYVGAPRVGPDTAREALVDADSTVLRQRVGTGSCPAGAPGCTEEISTTRRIPTLGQRLGRNLRVATLGVVAPVRAWRARGSPPEPLRPLLIALIVGGALALFVLFRILSELSAYVRGHAEQRIEDVSPGESLEDVIERRVLQRFNGLAIAVVAVTLILLKWLGPPLEGAAQIAWLLVPAFVFAGMRFVSFVLATVFLPHSSAVWTRRMRSLWGAYQTIGTYGLWLTLFLGLLPLLVYALSDYTVQLGWGALLSLIGTRLLTRRGPASGTKRLKLTPLIRNFALALLVALVFLAGTLFFATLLAGRFDSWQAFAAFGLGTVTLLYALGLAIDNNKVGPQAFYADRLAETYLLSEVADPENRLRLYRDAMEMPLSCLHGHATDPGWRNPAPYHLISAAINLAGSRDLTRRDRKSGYWLFSKLFCGSKHTGYRETAGYRRGGTRLARAASVSGAAASSGIGFHTFFAQSFATVLFNIRLGYWMENPRYETSVRGREGVWWPAYLWREVFMHTTENTRLVNLSDGGHTGDNVGIYPLLERRCKIIIAVDAEQDIELAFGSFTEALRHAYIDLGIDVDIDLTMIRPDEKGESRSHCAVGRIRYPDRPNQESYLIYLKNSITGDEPEPVLNYRTRHQRFPHESTVDEFFDDGQFESYRALGVHIAEHTFGYWSTLPDFERVAGFHQPVPVP